MEPKPHVDYLLNILSLEDSAPDYEIICRLLTEAGYNFNISRVDKEKEFEASLRNNQYDIILADFNLPGFDAFGALHLRNEICPEIPFICVSGSIGEELAIELLKLGASDYVLKDRPGRLPFAIKRALEDFNEKIVRRKAEKELRKLVRAVDQSVNAIIITDTTGTIEYVNPVTCKLTGFTREELIGKNPRILSSGETTKEEYARLWGDILAGKEWIGEFHNKNKNGELYWESASISPIMDEKGRITNFLAIKSDITRDKFLKAELIEAKEHAEESDRLKTAFLCNMSHEIRTPMNGILGFADLLKEPGLSGEEQLEYIRIIQKSGARMLNIINNIVDISKIESGQMKVSLAETNVNEQMEFICNFFKSEVEKKGLQLTLGNLLPSSSAIIRTDSEKLHAILANLVNNAIKYTSQGSVEFGCHAVEKLHATSIQFYVKDTGIGIPRNRLEAIFERFIQADITDKMARQGAGLGLAISKAYVEMLGGRIWVESQEDKGSSFYFSLPANHQLVNKSDQNINMATLSGANTADKLKVVIAEDDEFSSRFIAITIHHFAEEIIVAQNGERGS